METEHTIGMTPSAQTKLHSIMSAESKQAEKPLAVRLAVKGGGCSGFEYGFTMEDTVAEDDFKIQHGEVTLLVDHMSMQYLDGSEIDYKETFGSAALIVKNPNAKSTCGCGQSFTTDM